MRRTIPVLIVLLMPGVVLVSGCASKGPQPKGGPNTVTVAHPVVREVTDYAYFTGRIEAYETVDIRAMVGGYIVKVNFLDGAVVRKDEVLFEIDPRTYSADYRIALAQLHVAEFQLDLAEKEFVRVVNSQDAVTRQEADQRKSAVEVGRANLEKAQGDLERKLLDLNFTRVKAPRDGVMGKTLLNQGNLVKGGTNGADKLATLVSQTPVYVNFDVDEPTHLKVSTLIREGSLRYAYGETLDTLARVTSIAGLLSTPVAPGGGVGVGGRVTAALSLPPGKRFSYYPVWVSVGNLNQFDYEGYVDFVNNQVDASTGTLRVRGIMPNFQGRFTPGDFVRVKVPIGPKHPAILIDDKAVANNLDDKFVYVINDKNQAVFTPVVLGGLHGTLREVVSGLKPTDRVVIVGIQRVRPDAEVTVKNGSMEGPSDAPVGTEGK